MTVGNAGVVPGAVFSHEGAANESRGMIPRLDSGRPARPS